MLGQNIETSAQSWLFHLCACGAVSKKWCSFIWSFQAVGASTTWAYKSKWKGCSAWEKRGADNTESWAESAGNSQNSSRRTENSAGSINRHGKNDFKSAKTVQKYGATAAWAVFYCFIFHQKKQIETSQHQYKDLQAKHEKETSELVAKHDADIQGFKQNLLDAEEALKSAQRKSSELEAQAEELQKQAEQARVSGFCHSASDLKFEFSVSVTHFVSALTFHSQIFAVFLFWTFPGYVGVG